MNSVYGQHEFSLRREELCGIHAMYMQLYYTQLPLALVTLLGWKIQSEVKRQVCYGGRMGIYRKNLRSNLVSRHIVLSCPILHALGREREALGVLRRGEIYRQMTVYVQAVLSSGIIHLVISCWLPV